jgi:hypothetical protein
MRCPSCKKPLVVTHRDRYESIEDHVSNRTPSLRDGYQCLDEHCVSNNLGAVWTSDGELFIHPPEGIKMHVATRMIELSSELGLADALDSWSHCYEHKKLDEKKRSFHVRIFNWKWKIYPSYSSKKSIFTLKLNNEWHKNWIFPKVEWYRKTSDNGWVHTSTLPTMVIFCLKQFNRNYESQDWEKCLEEIDCITSWGKKDERLYTRVSSVLVKILHPFKCHRVRKEILKSFQGA